MLARLTRSFTNATVVVPKSSTTPSSLEPLGPFRHRPQTPSHENLQPRTFYFVNIILFSNLFMMLLLFAMVFYQDLLLFALQLTELNPGLLSALEHLLHCSM